MCILPCALESMEEISKGVSDTYHQCQRAHISSIVISRRKPSHWERMTINECIMIYVVCENSRIHAS